MPFDRTIFDQNLQSLADSVTTSTDLLLTAKAIKESEVSELYNLINEKSTYLGEVASEAEMLALTGNKADWVIRTDTTETWIITGDDPSLITSWTKLAATTPVPTNLSELNNDTGFITSSALPTELATESNPGFMSAEDKKKVEENSLLVLKDSFEVQSADTTDGFVFDQNPYATVGKKLVIKNPTASSGNHPLAFSTTDPNSVITQITENVVDEQLETSQEISLIITDELVSSLSNGVLYYYCRIHSSSAAMKGKIVIKEGGTEEFSQWSNGIVGPITLLLPVKEKQIHYETIIPTSDFTLNLTGVATGLTVDTSFNDSLAVGESMTVVFMMDLGSTPYKVSDLQIDSATQSVKWSFGMTPEGTANSRDVYSYTILKTADSTYSVLGNYTSYL